MLGCAVAVRVACAGFGVGLGLLAAGSVAVRVDAGGAVGLIGFLGLLAPHLARALVGVDGRRVMPVAALIGALVLLVADLLAQRIVRSLELPVGAVTAVLGAVSLILILRRGPERGY